MVPGPDQLFQSLSPQRSAASKALIVRLSFLRKNVGKLAATEK
ncbi:hypothetical protein C4K26_4873 [Pseudomonas chlororaphis]|nr:hypothetical protein C4K26_4873 [Pseudomonas chlororaphis]